MDVLQLFRTSILFEFLSDQINILKIKEIDVKQGGI